MLITRKIIASFTKETLARILEMLVIVFLQENMELVEETYDRKKMSITCNHMGSLGTKEFNHISCRLCDEIVLPDVKKKNKFDKSASVTDIIGSCDTKKISVKYLDMAGCFFPWEKHVYAGPNHRRFIVRRTLHELCDKIKKFKKLNQQQQLKLHQQLKQ